MSWVLRLKSVLPWAANNRVFSLLGVYKEKPSLTVDSGPKGFSERNVTLVCHTKYFFEIFILCRGGNASFPQNCLQQDHNTFLIFPLSPGHKTTYRCFASFQRNSYLWSQPSDPLELSVPGKDVWYLVTVSVLREFPMDVGYIKSTLCLLACYLILTGIVYLHLDSENFLLIMWK